MIDLRTLLRRAGVGLGVFLIFFLIIAAGFRVKAARAFGQARQAEEKGDDAAAIGLYDSAIRNHYPFSSIGGQSRDRLLAIAEKYEQEGKKDDARNAYQTLLSALCAVETGLSGNRALVDRLEKKSGNCFRQTLPLPLRRILRRPALNSARPLPRPPSVASRKMR